MANTYLTRTFGSPTNNYKWTFSAWIKKCGVSEDQYIFQTYPSGEGYMRIYFEAGDTLKFDGEDTSQSNAFGYRTTRLFRDTNAWYHLVVKWDVTQGTAGDRAKIYINGVQETSFSSSTNPAQNTTYPINRNKLHNLGRHSSATDTYFNGLMSHVHFTDGYSYDASTFGSTDATTGEWKINTSPTMTMGTNGFTILKDGNTITDQSSNSNNFTLGNGTLVDYVDNPSNIFCTLNNRMEIPGSTVYNASSEVSNTNGSHKTIYGSIPFITGKYYWEAKAKSGSAVKHTIGLSDVRNSYNFRQTSGVNNIVGNSSSSYGRGDAIGWYYNEINKSGSTVVSGVHQIANNDIMMVACDADNGKIYFGVNGTWRVANSTTFDAAQHDTTFTTGKFYLPAFSNENCGWFTNFGNGFFGATAITSAGTNASGIGTFEYDVPTGFTALSTEGLNE